MKFKNIQEKRWVLSRLNGLLAPMLHHLSEQDQEAIEIALGVLNFTEAENERKEHEDENI